MSAIQVTEQTFAETIQQSDHTVLVDFWAPWCGPCRAMGKVVDELAEDFAGQASVVKVNIDELGEQAVEYGVQAIPAFVVLRNGEVLERVVGAVSKEKLRKAIEPHLD